MSNLVKNPYPLFNDVDGAPLDAGYVYIGERDNNPLANPLQAYWDVDLTTPASNIRTIGGYFSYNGSPGVLYTEYPYSILIQNKKGETVFSSLSPPVDTFDSLSIAGSITIGEDMLLESDSISFTETGEKFIWNTAVSGSLALGDNMSLLADGSVKTPGRLHASSIAAEEILFKGAPVSTFVSSTPKIVVRNWYQETVPDGDLYGVTFSESLGMFVAVGYNSTSNIQYSTDGISWTQLTVPDGDLTDITFSESLGIFVAVGYNSTNNIQYSYDGIAWTQLTVPDGDLIGITFSESLGIFVAVGSAASNNIQYSYDGIAWTQLTVPDGDLAGVCFSDTLEMFVAVGAAATNNIQHTL